MLADHAPEGLLLVGQLLRRSGALDQRELPPVSAIELAVAGPFAAQERPQALEHVDGKRLGPRLGGRLVHEPQGSFDVADA